MNPYNLSVLFFAFSTFLVGIIVLLKRQDEVGIWWFIFSLCVSVWGIGYSFQINNDVAYEKALLASRIADGAAIFIPATWLRFIYSFLRLPVQRKFFVPIYVFTLFLFVFSPTSYFVKGLKDKSYLGLAHFVEGGVIFHLFSIFFFALVAFSFFKIIITMRNTQHSHERKIQLRYLLVASAFGYIGGSPAFFPVYDIDLPILYFSFLTPLFPFLMTLAIMRHHFLDLEEIVAVTQREKLATIGLIAASINHEIRNPLYAAKGFVDNYLEFIQEGLKQKDPMEMAQKVQKQIARALDVITKLNRFAKPSVEPEATGLMPQASVQEAIQNVLDLISYEFELDRIHIQNNLPKDLPNIQADQRQLEEILFNLIVNACHAMSASGKGDRSQSLTDRPVPFSYEEGAAKGGTLEIFATCHASHVTLHISDTGTGIPSEQAKHLFEPFHTTKGEKGTGLGLYITKQLIERNQGKITVKSQEGKGTSFVLEFKVSA